MALGGVFPLLFIIGDDNWKSVYSFSMSNVLEILLHASATGSSCILAKPFLWLTVLGGDPDVLPSLSISKCPAISSIVPAQELLDLCLA